MSPREQMLWLFEKYKPNPQWGTISDLRVWLYSQKALARMNETKALRIASGKENGPTVPQNVKQLRSDLPITSLGHTEKDENHIASKLVHTVSQVPNRTGNAHKHVNQSLWSKRGISSFKFTQWNNPKSYSTTIWITGHYWIVYYKTPHSYNGRLYGNEAAMYWARWALMNCKNAMFSD